MIPAATSGVLYTVDPNRPRSGEMILGIARGLADRAVQGDQSMAHCIVSRQPPHAVLAYRPPADGPAERAATDGEGELVMTNLVSTVMPIIRDPSA